MDAGSILGHEASGYENKSFGIKQNVHDYALLKY